MNDPSTECSKVLLSLIDKYFGKLFLDLGESRFCAGLFSNKCALSVKYLKKDLKCPEAACILNQKGYDCDKADQCIKKLAGHLMQDDTFPHEIGLFLGYPPKDVQGFIDNPCSGVKCVGCWKVYSDEEKAERIFKKYKKCTEVYRRLNQNGRTLAALAVNTSKYMAG